MLLRTMGGDDEVLKNKDDDEDDDGKRVDAAVVNEVVELTSGDGVWEPWVYW